MQYSNWLYTSTPVTCTTQLTSTAAALMMDWLVTEVTWPRSLEHFAPERMTLSVRFRLQSQTPRIVRTEERHMTKYNAINMSKLVLRTSVL